MINKQNRKTWVISLIAIAFLHSGVSASKCEARAQASTANATAFDATGYWVGDTSVVFTRNAVRINWPYMYLVAAAPDWAVTIYSAKTKKGMRMPYKQYLSHNPRWKAAIEDHEWPRNKEVIKIGSAVYKNVNCTKYTLADRDANQKLIPRVTGQKLTLLVADTPNISQQVSEIVGKTFDLPSAPGLPLYMETITASKAVHGYALHMGGTSACFKTSDVRKQLVKPEYFTHPKIGVSVEFENEIGSDSSTKSDVEYFLSDPNEDSKRKK